MTPKLITTTTLLAALALGVVPAAATAQDYYGNQGGYGYQGGDRDGYRDHDRDRDGYGGEYARQGYQSRQVYVQQGYYGQGYVPQGYGQGYNQGYVQRGYGGYGGGYYQRPAAYGYNGYNQDYRYRCRNNNTGTIIGAIAGGLIGNGVAGRGDGLLGAVIGGGAGALAGSAIDHSNRRC